MGKIKEQLQTVEDLCISDWECPHTGDMYSKYPLNINDEWIIPREGHRQFRDLLEAYYKLYERDIVAIRSYAVSNKDWYTGRVIPDKDEEWGFEVQWRRGEHVRLIKEGPYDDDK